MENQEYQEYLPPCSTVIDEHQQLELTMSADVEEMDTEREISTTGTTQEVETTDLSIISPSEIQENDMMVVSISPWDVVGLDNSLEDVEIKPDLVNLLQEEPNYKDELPSPKEVSYTAAVTNVEGVIIFEQDPEDTKEKIVYFVNNDAKISPSPVIQYVLDVDQPFDTVISCADGKMGAHRLVLASASPFVGAMFSGHDHRLGEVAVLILPDVRFAVMKSLLNFCYTGSMFFTKEDENDVVNAMKFLYIGEYGKLSLKEVTIKQEVPDSSATQTSQSQTTSEDYSSTVCNSNSTEIEDSVIDGVSEDEENHEDAPTEDIRNDNDPKTLIGQVNENNDTPSSFSGRESSKNNKKKHSSSKSRHSESSRHKYLVTPIAPGSKVEKYSCVQCPGAFKGIETLSTHLENNHGVFIKSRAVERADWDKLLYCEICKVKHSQIPATNGCLTKRSRTRCFVCLEVIHSKKIEQHVLENHAEQLHNGMCVVKCKWCDAGIVFGNAIDNKLVAAHCYKYHFIKSQGIDLDKKGTTLKQDIRKTIEEEETQVISTQSPRSVPSSSTNKSLTPRSGSMPGKAIPAVLQLLQKAGLKRKSNSDSVIDRKNSPGVNMEFSNPNKKIRLDKIKLQVARRTGTPIGRQINPLHLSAGVPNYVGSSNKSRGKNHVFVLMDVTKLPDIFVQFDYGKSFVQDFILKKPISSQNDDTVCFSASPKDSKTISYNWESTFRCVMPLL